MFTNLPPADRSKLQNIFLLAVGNSRELKTTEAKRVLLLDAIRTVNRLAGPGIRFDTPNGTELLHGCIIAYAGDALACNNIAGFKESFGPNVRFGCRSCKLPTSDFSMFFYHGECPLRSDRQINAEVLNLEKAETPADRCSLSKLSGINGRSVLSELKYFSLTCDLLYDPFHILLQGIVPKEISLFLLNAIRTERWFSRKHLNDALSSFAFHKGVSKSDYPRLFDSELLWKCVTCSAPPFGSGSSGSDSNGRKTLLVYLCSAKLRG